MGRVWFGLPSLCAVRDLLPRLVWLVSLAARANRGRQRLLAVDVQAVQVPGDRSIWRRWPLGSGAIRMGSRASAAPWQWPWAWCAGVIERNMNWCSVGLVGWVRAFSGRFGGFGGVFDGMGMGWAGRRVNDARGRCCCGLCLGQAGLRLRPAGRRGHWVSWWLDRGRPPAAGFWFGFFVRPKSNDLPCRVDR